ncbi:MAG: cobalamin biosynthesis protein CobD [Deltaproteobacteria bacterium]|nr:cobalamin biosynthesis protein CobD [Deltaproteobacteria bacterium]
MHDVPVFPFHLRCAPLLVDFGGTAAAKNDKEPRRNTGIQALRQVPIENETSRSVGDFARYGGSVSIFPWSDPWLHAAVLAVAFALDRWLGEPPVRIHPVVWMGTAIGWARDRAPRGPVGGLVWGLGMAVLLPALAAGLLTVPVALPWIGPIYAVWLVTSCFAARGLVDAGERLAGHAEAGELADARTSLGWLCSRDPSGLELTELTAAATESVVENASDSVVAPMVWYALAGIPGLVVYRCVNTLDAMVGYRGKYEWLGKASARLDDLMNLIPARLTALMLLAAGATVPGCDPARGWRVFWRDGRKTSSPNAGRPMAAAAGLLGVELSKTGHYTLGAGLAPSSAASLRTACRISDRTMTAAIFLFVLAMVGVAAAR